MTVLSNDAVSSWIGRRRILPVVILEDADKAEPLAEALLRAGLDLIEITFRTAAAAPAIRRIAERFPEMLVGAGTLLTTADVERAAKAGARFGVAPGLNEKVVRHAQNLAFPFVPGVMTPSEVEQGLELGCRALKFFPAKPAGGVPMLKAILAAYRHTGVRFIPTGGVDRGNLAEWLQVKEVLAAGSSWIVEPALIAAGDFEEIARRTSDALAVAQGADL